MLIFTDLEYLGGGHIFRAAIRPLQRHTLLAKTWKAEWTWEPRWVWNCSCPWRMAVWVGGKGLQHMKRAAETGWDSQVQAGRSLVFWAEYTIGIMFRNISLVALFAIGVSKDRGSSAHFSSVTQSGPTQWHHGLQHARLPCPSPTSGAYSNSCPLSQWCHPTISSSVVPFSSHLQSFPASGSFPMSQLFTSGGQNISNFSLSLSPSNEYSGLISFRIDWLHLLSSKWFSIAFSNTSVQKH